MGNSVSKKTCEEVVNKFQYFPEADLRMWLLQFESLFPSGSASKDDLEFLLTILFPFGNCKKFTNILFDSVNLKKSSKIDFNELLIAFSIFNIGSDYEKLRWTYRFFNINNDGNLTRKQIEKVYESLFEMYGAMFGEFSDEDIAIIVNKFEEVDGKIEFEEFKRVFSENERSFLYFNDFS